MTSRTPVPAVFVDACEREGWEHDGDTAVVALPGGRSQRVAVDVITDGKEQVLRFCSRIGDAAVLTEQRALAALRMNARLRLGAIAIRDDAVALVDTMLLREADCDEVRACVAYLARKADELEQALFGSDTQ
jgi:hypothetical protein